MTDVHADLFGRRNARTTDPETSHAAARQLSQRVRSRVYAVFQRHPDGLTDEELEHAYGAQFGIGSCRADSPRKRRSDLAREGFLEDSGRRRLSSANRLMIVWKLRTEGA
jgi:hypothetical protein